MATHWKQLTFDAEDTARGYSSCFVNFVYTEHRYAHMLIRNNSKYTLQFSNTVQTVWLISEAVLYDTTSLITYTHLQQQQQQQPIRDTYIHSSTQNHTTTTYFKSTYVLINPLLVDPAFHNYGPTFIECMCICFRGWLFAGVL